MSEQNKALVRQAITAINDHDLDALSRTLSVGYVQHVRQGDRDWQVLSQAFKGLFRALPDLHLTIDDMVAEGDKVAARLTFRGTHRGEFRRVAPTGKQVSWRSIHIFRFVGGKIAEDCEVSDGLMQALQS